MLKRELIWTCKFLDVKICLEIHTKEEKWRTEILDMIFLIEIKMHLECSASFGIRRQVMESKLTRGLPDESSTSLNV